MMTNSQHLETRVRPSGAYPFSSSSVHPKSTLDSHGYLVHAQDPQAGCTYDAYGHWMGSGPNPDDMPLGYYVALIPVVVAVAAVGATAGLVEKGIAAYQRARGTKKTA